MIDRLAWGLAGMTLLTVLAAGCGKQDCSLAETVQHWRSAACDRDGDGRVTVRDVMLIASRRPALLKGVQRVYGVWMMDELDADWGHNWSASVFVDREGFAFWLAPSSSDWQDSVTGAHLYGTDWNGVAASTDFVYQQARAHPQAHWVLGEEPNWWQWDLYQVKWGHFYLSPELYARWYHDYLSAIRAGWKEAGGPHGLIFGFYLLGDQADATPETVYLDRFWAEWQRNGWVDESVLDGFIVTHRPGSAKSGPESFGGGIAKTAGYLCGPAWETACKGGFREWMEARPWLAGRLLIVETNHGIRRQDYEACRENPACTAIQTEEDIYADVAARLTNLLAWADATSGVDGVLWYEGFDTSDWAEISSLFCPRAECVAGDRLSNPQPGRLTAVGQVFLDWH